MTDRREMRTEVLPFSLEVPALDERSQEFQRTSRGYILEAHFNFPQGVNCNVDARVLLRGGQGRESPVIPRHPDSSIALDHCILSLRDLWIPFAAGQLIRVEWRNQDEVRPYRVPVILVVGETE